MAELPDEMGFLAAYARSLGAAGSAEPSSYSRDNVGFMYLLLAYDLVHRYGIDGDLAHEMEQRFDDVIARVPVLPDEKKDEAEFRSLVEFFLRIFNLIRDTPHP